MDLPLEIIRTRGRARKSVEVELVRELEAEDLGALQVERGVQAKPITRLRERHHALAKLIASGRRMDEAASICGYSLSHVSILRSNPSFQNLVKFYEEDQNRIYASVHEQLAGMSLDAAIILRERMEESPDDFSPGQLLAIVEKGADRTGNGPTTKAEVNVNIGLADRLESARRRVADRIIDVTPEE